MTKQLNTNAIVNELENSSFFPQKPMAQNPPVLETPQPQPKPSVLEPDLPVRLSPTTTKAVAKKPTPALAPVPTAAPTGRSYARRTFDIYADQLAYLTRTSLEDKLAGGEGSMNAMVREALDSFIAKRRKEAA
jgi:hypothetical protein